MNRNSNGICQKKRKPGGKLFFSVLVTYLLLLVVALSLLLTGYIYSIRQSRKDMESAQVVFLRQVQRELDLRLGNVTDISNLLASHPLTKSVSSYGDEKPVYQTSYRDLNQVVAEQNNLISGQGETVLYFPGSDSVITGKARYRSENLDAYTKSLGMSPQEFREFVSSNKTHGQYVILHPNTAKASLAYLEPVLNDSYQRIGTVVTLLHMSSLRNTLDVGPWLKNSVCCMISGDSSLYISAGEQEVFPQDVDIFQDIPLNATPTAITVLGDKYITVGLRSAEAAWNYYFSVPIDVFYRNGSFYILLLLIALCASMAVGIFLAFLFSRWFSKPVNNILEVLHLNGSTAYPDAIRSLESAITTYQTDLSATQSQLYRAARQKRNAFLYDLTQGRLTSKQIALGIKEQEISLTDAPTALLLFTYHNTDESIFFQNGSLDYEMLLFASCNTLEELLCPETGAVFSHDGQAICLYQSGPGGPSFPPKELLEKIHSFHRDILGVELHILSAGPGVSLSDLPELSLETEEMMQYKFFWSGAVPDILHYEETRCTGSDTTGSFDPLDAEKRFLNLLAIRDYKNAHQLLLQQLDSGISKDLRHFRREQYRICGFISNLLENLSEFSAQDKSMDTENLTAALEELLAAKSMEAFRQQADSLFLSIMEYQQRLQSDEYPAWVREVRAYIEAHYDNPQLDVSYLAEQFHMNVSHLSRTYKKSTSIGVLDNIHMVRLSKAKELLAQGVSVQKTSEKVGYPESRALIRAFKRYESITPGQYQEMNWKPLIRQ